MSRARKLLIVGLVLAVGFGLAWPFRRASPLTGLVEPSGPQSASTFDPLAGPAVPQPVAQQVVAKMTSTGGPTTARDPGEASFDLATHPAASSHSTFKLPLSREAQAVASEAEGLQEVLHIVRNTDTLEKLADRYLGDAGRALEIFDLNRDQLSNPYLLPIGAKLRIPAMPGRVLD